MQINLKTKQEEDRETELGLLPRDWGIKCVEDIYGLKQGKQLSSKTSKEGKIKRHFLRTSNVFWNKIDTSNVDQMYFTEEEFRKLKLKKGDILVCEGGDIGRTALFNNEIGDCAYQNHLHRLRPKDSNIDNEFFVLWMQYGILLKGMYIYNANRTTIPNLSGSRLKSFKIPLPPLPEQQKIAHVLSTIQEAKEKTENVIHALKKLKKSMMKHLFTYGPVPVDEADSVPLKETEIGEVPEGWGIVKLEDLTINSFGGGTPSTKKSDYWDGSIPWTTSAIIHEDDVYLNQFQRRISELGLRNSSSKITSKGSFLIGTRVGVGKAVIPKIDIAINQDLTAIELKTNQVYPEFLSLLFKTYHFQQWFENNKRGATIKGVPRKDLLSLYIPLPPLSTQQNIAEILLMVYEKIEKEENKKKALDELFKSMLHNLMTAKIRVKDLAVNKNV